MCGISDIIGRFHCHPEKALVYWSINGLTDYKWDRNLYWHLPFRRICNQDSKCLHSLYNTWYRGVFQGHDTKEWPLRGYRPAWAHWKHGPVQSQLAAMGRINGGHHTRIVTLLYLNFPCSVNKQILWLKIPMQYPISVTEVECIQYLMHVTLKIGKVEQYLCLEVSPWLSTHFNQLWRKDILFLIHNFLKIHVQILKYHVQIISRNNHIEQTNDVLMPKSLQ